MTAYPDTSFLCAFYLKQSNSPAAAAHAATMKEPLHVTAPLVYEFRQSLRFQAWRHAANPRQGVALPDAQAALIQFEADLANGVAVLAPCNFQDVFRRAEALSARHTIDQVRFKLDQRGLRVWQRHALARIGRVPPGLKAK